jgi:hypothetical protein
MSWPIPSFCEMPVQGLLTNFLMGCLFPIDLLKSFKKCFLSLVLVARTCNPCYSGGRDQKDQGLKPAWANSL